MCAAVLGLDPGTKTTGAAWLADNGQLAGWRALRMKGDSPVQRMYGMKLEVQALLAELCPRVVVLERVPRGKGVRPDSLGALIKDYEIDAKAFGCEVKIYVPSQWRKMACGDGGLSKQGGILQLHIGYPDLRVIPAKEQDVWEAGGLAKAYWEWTRDPRLADMANAAARGEMVHVMLKRKAGG